MSSTVTCAQPDCRAPEGGPCALEHPDPNDCPQASIVVDEQPSDPADGAPPRVDETVEPGTEELAEPSAPSGVPLGAGVALTQDEANNLASEAGIRLVVPIGSVKAGKTTLIVGLYERFLRGPWGGSTFLWSETLLDLEMLAFPGRLASGAGIPTTWRTKLDGIRHLLHLRISRNAKSRSDLVFANLPGELSDRIRDGESPLDVMPLLAGADRVLICLDGESIASGSHYGLAISHARQVLRTIREETSLPSTCSVALVLTKLDKVQATDEGMNRWQVAQDQLKPELQALGLDFTFITTAALVDSGQFANDGMETLMEWLAAADATPATTPISVRTPDVRSSERFTKEQL